MTLLYADEDFDHGVVDALIDLGHDAVTVQGLGRAGIGVQDQDVLTDAIKLGRAVITFNYRHFRRLARSTIGHFGIISCSREDDVQALASRIDEAVRNGGDLRGRFIRVVRPNIQRD